MAKKKTRTKEPEFDVALSFAGTDRPYVENVATHLRKMGVKVFYDKYEKVTLWGRDLYAHLQDVYFDKARYVVMFVSKSYRDRLWTNHERKSAQARAFQENREYILPARFDGTRVPGLLDTTGYVDLRETQPKELATLIRTKLGTIERNEFFPSTPDRLFKPLQAKSKQRQQLVCQIANHYFEMSKLMTRGERLLIAAACRHACPCGLPDDVHLRLDYLARIHSRLLGDVEASQTEDETDIQRHTGRYLSPRGRAAKTVNVNVRNEGRIDSRGDAEACGEDNQRISFSPRLRVSA